MFKLHFTKPTTGESMILYYDHLASILYNEAGELVVKNAKKIDPTKVRAAFPFSKDNPLYGKKNPSTLKIQLGLKCNFECSYCLQKAVPHADDGTLKKIPAFLEKMPTWFNGGPNGDGSNFRVQLWGGEPMAYWKTLVPLAEGIKKLYPKIAFSIITNGSLLTKDKIDWLIAMNFNMSISHDGPGQWVRGPDPLEDPEMLETWRYAKSAFKAARLSFSINPTLNKDNSSFEKITEFFTSRFGDDIRLGEGGYALTYNDDAAASAPMSARERQKFAKESLAAHINGKLKNFGMVTGRRDRFIKTFYDGKVISGVGASCGADKFLTVDLDGNVITCQNTSAVATAGNGESHLIGSVDALDKVKFSSSTHWSQRANCKSCPVLQSCKGTCVFLDGDYFKSTCDISYSEHIAVVAAGFFELLGGWLLYYIDDNNLPPERRDPFGFANTEIPVEKPKPKIIPIKAVSFAGKPY